MLDLQTSYSALYSDKALHWECLKLFLFPIASSQERWKSSSWEAASLLWLKPFTFLWLFPSSTTQAADTTFEIRVSAFTFSATHHNTVLISFSRLLGEVRLSFTPTFPAVPSMSIFPVNFIFFETLPCCFRAFILTCDYTTLRRHTSTAHMTSLLPASLQNSSATYQSRRTARGRRLIQSLGITLKMATTASTPVRYNCYLELAKDKSFFHYTISGLLLFQTRSSIAR